MNDGPIFLIGTMRSGSTLLRLILDSHPRIAIPMETGFMRAAAGMRAIPRWKPGREWSARIGVDAVELDRRVAAFFRTMFADWAAAQGKQRWGDKTPFNLSYVQQMAELFPDATFVGITRHPGAVATSLSRRGVPFERAVARWCRGNTQLVNAGEDLGSRRFCLCRYEDLVVTPEPVLRLLVAFLGEEWSDDLLAHDRLQRSRGAPRLVEGGTDSARAIDPSPVDAWRATMTPARQQQVQAECGDLCRLFGYALDTAAPLPLFVPGRQDPVTVLDGDGLRRRREAVLGPARLVVPRGQREPVPPAAGTDRITGAARLLAHNPREALARLRASRRRGAAP